ncbi:MAG: antA/AntB antirepressor family protein [Methanobrevibacter sp.]|nr:antA/AntB antirepressor family protein [Methanobrevibacter sp.]
MNDLIKISFGGTDELPTVSGRELHEALEVKSKYADWFKNMCSYGFAENRDYFSFSKNLEKPEGGRPAVEHALTIPMAKELCMLQRSEKGKQFRQYFIQVEEQWNKPEAVMARALKFANNKLAETKVQIQALENTVMQQQADITRMKPKEIFADAVADSDDTILIRELAKLLKQNGVNTGEKRLYAWMRDNGYIMRYSTLPTQKAMDLELFIVKESARVLPDGKSKVDKVTKVTGKGQIYFLNKGKKLKEMDGER